MPKKNVVQDVVPGKKSIRNVTLSSRTTPPVSRHREEDDEFTRPVAIKQAPLKIEAFPSKTQSIPPLPTTQTIPPKPPVQTPSYTYEYSEPKKPRRKWVYFAVSLFVIVLGFGVSAFFKSAVIRVSPKEATQNLNDTFRATKDATGTSLGFQVVTISKEFEKTVTATGEQKVEKKASGRIVIYNETAQTQKLVATTRFETPEGLLFRLPTAVTVPARTVKDGKTVAGSVEVTVEADKVGPSYNIGLKDFTLPGLKGDPKFKTIYARSKTEMTGGFSGMQKVVSKEVMDQAELELTSQLRESLAKDIITQIPANFVLYESSLSYSLSPAEQVTSTTEGATLKKKGTTSAVIFDKSSLTKTILAKISPSVSSDTVKITNLESLTFAYPSGTTFNPNSDSSLSFSLTGDARIVWIFDENKLKTDLLGLSRAKAKVVLASYDTIKEAWVETRPFWNGTIPNDPLKVTLINTLTE